MSPRETGRPSGREAATAADGVPSGVPSGVPPLRVVLADDERPARSFLAAMLRAHADVVVVGEASDGAAAVQLIERERPDVAFLDLQMPELDGLEVVRLLRRDATPLVIFVTAHDQYAVRAFEAHAVDYLLKPVAPARLAEALTRAHERLERRDAKPEARAARLARAAEAIEGPAAKSLLRRIPARHHDDVVLVPVERVAVLEADGETVRLITASNERFSVPARLKDLEERLDPARFIRVSRAQMCNAELIVRVSPQLGGLLQLTLANGLRLTASRLRSRELRDSLLAL